VVVATVPVGPSGGALGVAVTPDGAFAYVTSTNIFQNNAGNVSVIDTATNVVVATIPVGSGGAWGVAVTPDGAFAYVTSSDNVSVIDTATNTGVATIPVGLGALGIAFRPLPDADEDDDGVLDTADLCPGTVIPESVPTTGKLGPNRYALTAADVLTFASGKNAKATFTTEDTGGCSCEQIAEAGFLGVGHLKNGCSVGEMRSWANFVAAQ
jgi:YVTN family beta-propeller protein